MPHQLILVRHGESEWNKSNQFTGWVDVRLSEKGRQEALRAGELLKEKNIKPDILYTSRLSRAIQTANIALDNADRLWLDTKRSWRLNERHYGALQGKNKSQIQEEFGEKQFMTWRRSFDIPPPEIEDGDKYSQINDERYAELDKSEIPKTESLKLVIDRLVPYWDSDISKSLKEGKTVLVVAHGNSIRAMVKFLDNVSDEDISNLNIPTAIPLVYELDDDLKPVKKAYYLDPAAAEAGAAAVASQGSKK